LGRTVPAYTTGAFGRRRRPKEEHPDPEKEEEKSANEKSDKAEPIKRAGGKWK
jgi:hypothetical protein